ncbi:MAG: glycosyltransferase family 4 protein, partial [Bacteroidia bacterium]
PKFIKFDKLNNNNATHIIPVSNETYNLILKYEKPNNRKIQIINHGVNQNFFEEINNEKLSYYKKKYQLENKIVIGTISRYVKSKGYEKIISAIQLLIKSYPNLKFLGVGYGPNEDYYKSLIKQSQLENHIILTGKIPYEDIPSIYRCLNIYIHAADYEPFGFVIAEAMFCKVPIISTKVGAAADKLEHLKSAYLLDSNNPEEIANAIKFMIENNTEQIIINAYKTAKENFSKEKMWYNYKKIFTEI